MKTCRSLIGLLAFPIALLMAACQTTHLPPGMGDARCENIAGKGYISVLTINLLFSEVDDRNKRLKAVADFASQNDVDVLLLQEVVCCRRWKFRGLVKSMSTIPICAPAVKNLKDYIFTKGFVDVRLSKVVFNTLVNPDEPTVSDHAGVFVRLGLPQNP